MQLITAAQRAALLANGAASAKRDIDPHPVVKLFTPDAGATWLLTELDPTEPDIAFGLCDLGLGCPELGYVRLSELQTVRGKLGLPVERDLWFEAKGRCPPTRRPPIGPSTSSSWSRSHDRRSPVHRGAHRALARCRPPHSMGAAVPEHRRARAAGAPADREYRAAPRTPADHRKRLPVVVHLPDITVPESAEFEVWGVVTNSIRNH